MGRHYLGTLHSPPEGRNQARPFPAYLCGAHPRGVFVNAEDVASPTPELSRRDHQQWLAQVRERGATEQEIAEAEYRMQTDFCSSMEDQLDWMREAGFADADCWFKEGRFAVMSGTRSL